MCTSKGRVKQAITISNIILALFSLIVIGLGVYVLKLENLNLEIFGNSNVEKYAIGVISSGCVLLVISVIGVCSVVMENYCLVKVYLAAHVALLLAFTICGSLMINYQENIKLVFKNKLESKLRNEYGCATDVTNGWDTLQIKNQCCGVTGKNPGKIYLSSKWSHNKCKIAKDKDQKVPISCCERDGSGKIVNVEECKKAHPISADAKFIYNKGCYDQVESKLDYAIIILISVLFILAFICLLGIIFGIMILRITFASPQFV